MIKQFIIIVNVLLFSAYSSNAQEQYIKNLLSKNIIYYTLEQERSYNQRYFEGEFIKEGAYRENWMKVIPDNNYSMELRKVHYDTARIKYPTKGFDLYAFYWSRYNFRNDCDRTSYSTKDNIFKYNDYYLVAYNKAENKVKFLTGSIFRTRFWLDFKGDEVNVTNIISFLYIKLFGYDIRDIQFDKRDGNKYYFNIKPNYDSSSVPIMFNEDDPENISIQGDLRMANVEFTD